MNTHSHSHDHAHQHHGQHRHAAPAPSFLALASWQRAVLISPLLLLLWLGVWWATA